jgi:NodT family efflux transporter outer membrane factor (OMF) lipoprotein
MSKATIKKACLSWQVSSLNIAVLVLCMTGLSSCMWASSFTSPAPPQASRYSIAADPEKTVAVNGQVQSFSTTTIISADWWKIFGSDELNKLVTRGLAHSPSVNAANSILAQSEHELKAGQGVFYPQVDLGASAVRERLSPLRLGVIGTGSIFNLYTLGATISYSMDIFGGEHRVVEGLAAQVDIERANVHASYISLVGNITNTAIADAAYLADIESMENLISLQRQQLSMIEARAEAGLIAASNILTIKSVIANNEAALANVKQRHAATQNLLANLIGALPQDADLPKLRLENLHLPETLPISLPSDLVRQRPDIRSAEASLHQASAHIGVANAALFPSFTLTGNYGLNNTSIGKLSNSNSQFWNIGPTVNYPLFTGGSLNARKESAIAGYNASLAKYRQTVLSAFNQIADTLQAISNDAVIAAARQSALESASEQFSLISANHDAGLVSDIDRLIARQQLETARIAMNDAMAQRYQDTVALYVGLGGGWWNAPCNEKEKPLSCSDITVPTVK